jgi:DNA-binding MarR family transcriptional regulator
MALDHKPLKHLLGYALARASIPTDQVFYASIGAPLQLRRAEFTILCLIEANEEVTAKRLSSALSLSAPNMSVVLDRLEKRGLIRRAQSGTDKRAQFLHLTAEGKALTAQAVKIARHMEDALHAKLTHGERALLFELLEKVAKQAGGG